MDQRLEKIGADWYWDGELVPRPIPENSPVSFAIAATYQKRRGNINLGYLSNWQRKQRGPLPDIYERSGE